MKPITRAMQHPEVIATIEELTELGAFYDHADARSFFELALSEIIDIAIAQYEADLRAEITQTIRAELTEKVVFALGIPEGDLP